MSLAVAFDEHRRRRVALGLGMVYAGLCISFLAVIWLFMGPLVILRLNLNPMTLLKAHAVIVASALLVAIALGITGRVYCLAAPRQSIGIVFVMALGLAVALDVLGVVVFGLAILHYFQPNVPSVESLEKWSTPLAFAGHFLFHAFLWRLAVVIERKGLAVLAIVSVGIFVATIVLANTWFTLEAMRQAKTLSEIIEKAAVLGLVGLVGLFVYGNLLTYLRRAVPDYKPAEEPAQANAS